MARNQVNITPNDSLMEWIESLSERSMTLKPSTVTALLEILRDSAARELQKTPWTLGEAHALAQMMAGSAMDLRWIGLSLIVGWHDTIDDWDTTPGSRAFYEREYGIDADAVTDKLASLTPLGDFALRDAITRWWRLDPLTDDGFAAVGLRIVTPADA